MANEELKKKIIDELIELKPENVSTQFLTSRFKMRTAHLTCGSHF